MNGFLNKKINHRIKNWLAPVKYAEMQSKNAVRNQYTNLYAYAANNPVHYIDPDGKVLINNVYKDLPSAKKYEQTHQLKEIAFSIKTLTPDGSARLPMSNTSIVLENGLNNTLLRAYQYKKINNYNVDVSATATKTENDNYKIDIKVTISHYDFNGKLIIDEHKTGTIAYADLTELGGIGPDSSVKQDKVNDMANKVINIALKIENANLIEGEK